MHPDSLFLRRCEQIERLCASSDAIDLLDLADALKQVLCDKHSLVDVANPDRLKLRFHVGLFSFEPGANEIASLEDGVDPEERRPGAPSAVMTRADFLAHKILWIHGAGFSVKDVIGHARNVQGGAHYDPDNTKDEYRPIAEAASQLEVGGYPVSIGMLRAIGRVTLRGLAPLIEVVRARHS